MLGLVGANGSGKSTMLKCLARILVPNSGSVSVQGKVSALLELGAGFHPELTGRENLYLGGSLLRLSKADIDALRRHRGVQRAHGIHRSAREELQLRHVRASRSRSP